MDDKEVYIDGVDVSGCKHYKNRTCIADYCLTDMPFSEAKCELNPNCHYKNWQRKEQECEKAKKIIETAVKDFSLEYGTPYYDKLLEGARLLGVEVKDYE